MDQHTSTALRARPWTESSGGLFESDVILPAQFFLKMRGRVANGGERRLIIAVLEDAVGCYQKYFFARNPKGRRLFREAEGWLMSTDRELPYSFENICDFLSFDADHLRQGLRRWARAAAGLVAESGAARRRTPTRSGAARHTTTARPAAVVNRVAAA